MTTALQSAIAAAKRLGFYHETTTNQHAKMVGAQIANELQALSDVLSTIEEMHAEGSSGAYSRRFSDDFIRDARAGLARVLEIARALRGGK